MQTSNLLNQEPNPPADPKQSLLQDISAALVVCDGQGVVSYANTQAEGLLGMDVRLIVGQQVRSLLSLQALEGDPLAADRIADLYRLDVMDEAFEDCALVCSSGLRIQVDCEIAAIGDGAVLIVLRPADSAGTRGTLAYRASHDALTGLLNRAYAQERLENLHRSAETQRDLYSLLLLDLDHFKIVNDRYGHATGDQVLAQVGRRVAHNVREVDTIGRWGGEEFLCLLPGVGRPSAEEIAERIRVGLEAQPFEYEGRHIRVTSSIGVATYPDDGLDPDALLAKVDAALYEAKRSGRNRIQSITHQAGNVFALAQIIEKSLLEERVRPAYQPVINLISGKVCGAEALARIQLDERQLIEAAYFIPAAEQLHLVHQIDHRIIQSAVMRCTAEKLGVEPMAAMFVNFSADFLRHPDLVEDVLETVKQQRALRGEHDDDVMPLVIEITERQFMDNISEAKETLQPFLDLGLRIAIDDFGLGVSSLNCLVELPVSFIKLEGSLVRRIASEERVRLVFRGIQELAADLGIITVAEGVDNQVTVEILRELGVDWAQGYFFARPMFQL